MHGNRKIVAPLLVVVDTRIVDTRFYVVRCTVQNIELWKGVVPSSVSSSGTDDSSATGMRELFAQISGNGLLLGARSRKDAKFHVI